MADDFKDLGFEESFDDLGFEPAESNNQPGPQFSASESALKGAQQGLTLGLSDEATGGIQALLDKLNIAGNKMGVLPESPSQVSQRLASEGFTGDLGPSSTAELYRQVRDEERAKIALAGEQNPVSFTAGGIAGSLAGTAAIPGAAGLTSIKGLTGAERILSAGKAGGVLGGAMAAGTSEADLTKGELRDFAKDVGQGAVMGASTGVLATGALEGVKNAGKLAAQSTLGFKTIDDLKDIFSRSSKGEQLYNRRPELAKKIQDEGFELFKAIKNKAEGLEQQKQNLLNVDGANKTVDLTGLLKAYSEKVSQFKTPDPDIKKVSSGLVDMIGEISSTQPVKEMPLAEAYRLKQLLQTTSNELKSPELQKLTNNASRELQDRMDEILPGLKALNKTQSNLMSQSESMFGVQPLQNIPDAEIPQFLKKTGETLEKFAKESAAQQSVSKEASLGGFTNLRGQEVPGIEKLVPEAAPLVSKAKETARSIDLAKKIDGKEDGVISKLTNVYKGADIAGKLAKPFVDSAKQFTSSVPEFLSQTSTRLREAAPEQLNMMADDITSKLGDRMSIEANILRKAAERRGVSRDALIFSLMQRPGFREYINEDKKEIPQE